MLNQRCILQRRYTYKSEYLREFETEFENILVWESGSIWGRLLKKTRGRQSRATVPLIRAATDATELVPGYFLNPQYLKPIYK